MREALVVMNPRDIRPCQQAFEALDLPRIHLVGMTETNIADDGAAEAMAIADDYGYEWLWWVSDDVIVRQPVLDVLRRLRDDGHPVVTGYCNLMNDDWRVNLTKSPLSRDKPTNDAYDWLHLHEAVASATEAVDTHFAGMCLTGMQTKWWEKYSFVCYSSPSVPEGFASDFALSIRLRDDNVPIVAHRDAWCFHWKWNLHSLPPMKARDAKLFFDSLSLNVERPRVELRKPR